MRDESDEGFYFRVIAVGLSQVGKFAGSRWPLGDKCAVVW